MVVEGVRRAWNMKLHQTAPLAGILDSVALHRQRVQPEYRLVLLVLSRAHRDARDDPRLSAVAGYRLHSVFLYVERWKVCCRCSV